VILVGIDVAELIASGPAGPILRSGYLLLGSWLVTDFVSVSSLRRMKEDVQDIRHWRFSRLRRRIEDPRHNDLLIGCQVFLPKGPANSDAGNHPIGLQ